MFSTNMDVADIVVCGRRHRFKLCQKCPFYWGVAKEHFSRQDQEEIGQRAYGHYIRVTVMREIIDILTIPAKSCRNGYWYTMRYAREEDIFIKANGTREFFDKTLAPNSQR